MDDEQAEAGAERAGDTAAPAFRQSPRSGGGQDGSSLGGDVQARIGQHLRAMYDDVVRQGVPDRFMDLLSQLDNAGGAKPSAGDEEAGR